MFLKALIAQRVRRLENGSLVLLGRGKDRPYVLPSIEVGEKVLRLESYEIYALMASMFGAINFGAWFFAACIALFSYLVWSRRKILSGLERSSEEISNKGSVKRFAANLPGWLPWVTIGLGLVPVLLFAVALTPAVIDGRRGLLEVVLSCSELALVPAVMGGFLLWVRKWANNSLQGRRP